MLHLKCEIILIRPPHDQHRDDCKRPRCCLQNRLPFPPTLPLYWLQAKPGQVTPLSLAREACALTVMPVPILLHLGEPRGAPLLGLAAVRFARRWLSQPRRRNLRASFRAALRHVSGCLVSPCPLAHWLAGTHAHAGWKACGARPEAWSQTKSVSGHWPAKKASLPKAQSADWRCCCGSDVLSPGTHVGHVCFRTSITW